MEDTSFLVSEVSKYTAIDWMDWIEDILYYNVAYPVSTLSTEGDVLGDMQIFLKENNISPKDYEKALISVLNKLLGIPFDEEKIIRILNAMVLSKSQRNKEILKTILFQPYPTSYNLFKETIKSKALQCLARLDLEVDEKNEITEYIYTKGWEEIIVNPFFVGNYLRLVLLNYSPENFFSALTTVILIGKGFSREVEPYMISVIEDKLREFHFNFQHQFSKNFYQWLVRDNKSLFTSSVFEKILIKFHDFLNLFNDTHGKVNDGAEEVFFGREVKKIVYYLTIPSTWSRGRLLELNDLCSFLINTKGEELFYYIALKNSDIFLNNITVYKNIFSFGDSFLEYRHYKSFMDLYVRYAYLIETHSFKSIEKVKQDLLEIASDYGD